MMEKKKHYHTLHISIKHGFSALLLLQAAVIAVCILVAIQIFYRNNTALLYRQASMMLDLYALNCETTMSMVEKWSFNILSDQSIQSEIGNVNDPELPSYDSYVARKNVKRLLTNYLFSIDQADTLSFIANDGTQLMSSYNPGAVPFSTQEAERLKALAFARNGGTVWTYDQSQQQLYLVRVIKEARNATFRDQGVLVIACPAKTIFNFDFTQTYGYNPVMAVSADNTALYYSDKDAARNFSLVDLDDASGSLVKVGVETYYTVARQSANTGWTYACFIANTDMLRNVNQLTNQIMLALALMLAVTLMTLLVFSSFITFHIQHLTRAMDEVSKGRYTFTDDRKPERLRVNEIDSLYRHFGRMSSEIDHLINDVFMTQITIKDMRYKMLRSQINPHFINNTLSTVGSIAMQRGQDEITLMVRSLSRMLRAALSERDLHSLREELAFLDSYIAIQRIRYEERLDFAVDPAPDYADVLIPKLTLQPLVENAINYGLERYARICTIRISFARQDNKLCIMITDNGPGMDADFIRRIFTGEIVPSGSGLGIKNINERIQLAFGEDYGVAFKSVPGEGTTAIITIPLEVTAAEGEKKGTPAEEEV